MNKSRQYGLFTDVPDELWNDWHWQVANRIETLEDLKKLMTTHTVTAYEDSSQSSGGRIRVLVAKKK